MTEQEWLTSTDPAAMLRFLLPHHTSDRVGGQLSEFTVTDRKLRLFAAACHDACKCPIGRGDTEDWMSAIREARLTETKCAGVRVAPVLLRDIFGNPFRPMERQHADSCPSYAGAKFNRECGCQPPWLTETVQRLAQSIYDERAFDRMPVLADALEEAWCQEEAILRHLRGEERCRPCEVMVGDRTMVVSGTHVDLDPETWLPKQKTARGAPPLEQCVNCHGTGWRPLRGPHVRGCWALDLILGLE